MLKYLEIKNYALIKHLVIDFDNGLNIITGETGAGKSILLGALGLIMGKRADSKVLFDHNNKCIVEAKFDLRKLELKTFFTNHDLEYDEELVIRREIAATGKSRAFINDTPATLDLVTELTDELIDLHQQFDTLALHKSKFQMDAVDAIAGIQAEVLEYRNQYALYKTKQKQLSDLQAEIQSANKETDYITYLYKEIHDAKLISDEQVELESTLEKLTSAEDIKRIGLMTAAAIEESETSMVSGLTEVAREMSSIAKIDTQYQSIYERLISAIEELKDIASEATNIAEDIEADPMQAQVIQERLSLIYKLQKKHQVTDIRGLLDIEASMHQKIKNVANADQQISELQKSIDDQQKSLIAYASKISRKRETIIAPFENQINDLLTQLAMPNARLKLKLTKEQEISVNGLDQLQFLFATNKGSDFLPLKEIASGGEMSRLTLCIKSVLASKMNLATMIFDEIDTGVSGEVASKMGLILNSMAVNHQLIVITHSPQIASKGDVHFYVYKTDEEERTASHMRRLNDEERLHEIAKMLSGDKPGKAAMENAKELLKHINT